MAVLGVPHDVLTAEIHAFESSFEGLSDQFKILDKIGEGTFSCVYRAIDLGAPVVNRSQSMEDLPKEAFVAVKRIHATSSPTRIRNELEILATLHSGEHVCSVVTAMRWQDQVIVVMPCIEFTDFRTMYTTCDFKEMQTYMAQLLKALAFTAERNVIHRDVKPTNFLYNRDTRHGVLVDFGLAEFEVVKGDCVCQNYSNVPVPPPSPHPILEAGYRKDDMRPARRANRAGTRGFRAPEVLLKCNRQCHKIDVWAAGVVLLMMLARKFPFFTSMDDADALVEMASIYGLRDMRAVANLHGAEFETNLPTISDHRRPWQQIIDWCNEHSGDKKRNSRSSRPIIEKQAVDLLERVLELDYWKRPSAAEALQHPFFKLE